MSRRILYIGNKLSRHGNVPTSVETLGGQLGEYYDVVSASDKLGYVSRMADMLKTIFANRNSAKLVIIDTYSTKNFYFAFTASQLCRILKIKYLPILRGGDLPNRLDGSKTLSRMLFKNSYVNVAPSGYLKYEFEKRGYNTVLIPNNIDIGDYEFTKREKFESKLLWVRSFAGLYNPKMTVEVAKKLKDRFGVVKLCMLGPDKDGSMGIVIDYCHEIGLTVCRRIDGEEDVLIPGRMGKEEWRMLSKKYDIFVSSTNFDNTPVSVIEAMALGLPIVSTNVGGMPYLIDNGVDGLLIDKEDADGMAEAIAKIIDGCIDGMKMAYKARKKVEEFDWERVKLLWFDLLNVNI